MGRFLRRIGGLLITLSMFGIGFVLFRSMDDLSALERFDPEASIRSLALEICEPGETLDTEGISTDSFTGSMSFSMSNIYCVNDTTRVRRDVSGAFLSGMLTQVRTLLPNLVTGLLVVGGMCGLGFLLVLLGVVIGFFMLIIRPARISDSLDDSYVTVGQPQRQFEKTKRDFSLDSGSELQTKLRQLEEARDKGLISQQEYDRLRQQILDSML